jgi:hypothetical protein
MFRSRVFSVTAALLAGALISACVQQRQPSAADAEPARQAVIDFEERMRAMKGTVVPSSLLSLFAPDVSDTDRRQRDRLIAELAAEADYHFSLKAYAVSDARCDRRVCEVTLRETRDYGTAARFGDTFDRVFVLEPYKAEWRVQQYKHLSRGNSYAGSLSGSQKYSGFYP